MDVALKPPPGDTLRKVGPDNMERAHFPEGLGIETTIERHWCGQAAHVCGSKLPHLIRLNDLFPGDETHSGGPGPC